MNEKTNLIIDIIKKQTNKKTFSDVGDFKTLLLEIW